MLIDTHCHLDFKDFDKDRDEVINRAKSAGVEKIINVASSVDGTKRAIELAVKYDNIYATAGVHPHEASSVTDSALGSLRRLAKENKVVAIGEVGLDYYRNTAPREEQVTAFKKFIHLARDLNQPLIIHSRDAANDALGILKQENTNGVPAVMHCFSGDAQFLTRCLDLGLYVSFTCSLTFKNAGDLRNVAAAMAVERLLLETDAPFLAPQVFRGMRNEPAFLTQLVDEWSRILGLSADDIARITTHNANRLFGLNLKETFEIAYTIRDSLYLNITNRCTNECDFCVRTKTDFVKGHNLKLEREPSAGELIARVGDPKRFKEIVFCGYGEPTMRLDVLKEVARVVKSLGGKVRVVTNGHGDLINKRPIAKELIGLVDKFSVSLNADTGEKYDRICKPVFGGGIYNDILSFVRSCVANDFATEVTCLDLPGVDLVKCEKIARSLGAGFRLRRYGVVG